MKTLLTTLAALAIAITLLTGCKDDNKKNERFTLPSPADPQPKPAKTTGTIGVSVLTLTNPFFKEIADAITDEAQKSGMTVIVVSGENQAATQYNQVMDSIARKVTAIVLTPCDSKAVGAAIQKANAAGIPVFTADIACTDPSAKVVSHIATDNYQGGRMAAVAMIKALGNKGNIAIIDHPTVESAQLRTKGFRDELAEKNSPIKIVAAPAGLGARDISAKVAAEVLTAHGDLAGIFAINDPTALGTYTTMEKMGRQVVIVGFDGQLEAKQAIKQGKIYADPIQFPDEIGRKTVQSIAKYLNGDKVENNQLIPTKLYYKEDAQKDPSLK